MPDEPTPRSRRALLAAAAGGAAALAAQAALPLTAVAADPNDVVLGSANSTTTPTTITNTATNGTAFGTAGTGTGYGLEATSTGGTGSFSWSVSAPGWWDPATDGPYTGAFAWSPAHPDPTLAGVGVWGESDDWGVFGQGSVGVYGHGGIGVIGESDNTSFPGVKAYGALSSSPALEVVGKVKFNRAGRKTIGAGKSSLVVSMAGVSSTSKVLAVLNSNRSGRYVRAVVPASGKFTIYLNSTVSSSTYVAFFVID
jgi:hypothetical protein